RFTYTVTQSLGNHSGDEILILDLDVEYDIHLADPLVELCGVQLLPDTGQDVPEIGDDDVSGVVLVKNLEGVAKLAIERLGLEVLGHEIQEPREIERRAEVFLDDDGLELRLSRIAA
ncbi:hypothetical protein U1Q18_038400, partial [Sarracenia purpurea var. burkii]